MGLLSATPGDLDLTTALISLWFRLPAATITAVQSRDASSDTDIKVMDHVVPLLMFGAQQSASVGDVATATAYCEYPPAYTIAGGTAPFTVLQYTTGTRSVPSQPSCIGIQCKPFSNPTLYVHLQPSSAPTVAHRGWDSGPGYSCPMTPADPIPVFSDATFSSIADGALGNSNNTTIGPSGGTPTILPDKWHHLLISWQLRSESAHGGNTVDSSTQDPAQNISAYSTMYCALDDVNKNRNNLPATWVGQQTDFSDPNAVVCAGIFFTAGWLYTPNPGGTDPYHPPQNTNATATMSYSLPSTPIWLPGKASINTQRNSSLVANEDVIMAELQIFTGALLDTSITSNRRLFVTEKGTPAPFSTAHSGMGFAPNIAIHGSANWRAGKNSGTSGDLSPGGTINGFTPDPGLS